MTAPNFSIISGSIISGHDIISGHPSNPDIISGHPSNPGSFQ
jgi:hypothetical protein